MIDVPIKTRARPAAQEQAVVEGPDRRRQRLVAIALRSQHVRQDRSDLQVGHEPALGLVVGVAHIVAVLHGLARQGATTRHGDIR